MPFTIGGEWLPSEQPEEKQSQKPVKVREVKRKGIELTCVLNLNPQKHAIKELARGLKRALGVGGTYSKETIEIQGHKRKEVELYLQKQGIRSS